LVTERNQRIRIKGDVSLKRKSGALGIEADLPAGRQEAHSELRARTCSGKPACRQADPTETNFIDIEKAAESQTYCDELKGKVNSYGLEITELCTHLQGQLVAVNPAYDSMFDGFAPEHVRGNPKARTAWAIDFIKKSGTASGRLGLTSHGSFSGALLWHTVYPLDHYHERIKAFHVKDAEFNPTGKQGVYGGYSDWKNRAGRFRSLGDGQVDFKGIFSKLSKYECDVWAVLEWECCIKSSDQGAREGAPFIQKHIIEVAERSFDDFAGGKTDEAQLKKILGL